MTITNVGSQTLTITSVTIGGPNADQFSGLSSTCVSGGLPPNAQCTGTVSFAPSSTGTKQAYLLFADNTQRSPDQVGLQGTGT